MDALLSEIATKRKAINEGPQRPTKYMRRGDIEKLKQEEARAASAQINPDSEPTVSKTLKVPSREATNSPLDTEEPKSETFNISNEETIRRLRSKCQPIRLFGESDKERRLRLRALELIEERDHDRHGGQNDFKKALEDVENVEREMRAKNTKGKKRDTIEQPVVIIDLALVKTDPDKLYPLIYFALKRTLREWGEAMEERPESVKATTQGRLAAATQVQSAEYLKPLFKQLKARALPADVLGRMAEIVHHMQKRQYQRANDAYLRLSIGNAPWPIGVTMVGIHERSAREKISTDQVAHVLNDEVSRKYIQSLKRLLTFSQTKYPPDDISQLMG
ncbi:SFM domain-containing protein [Mycena indigotica]|uniref:Pre-mRNA-splicing factor 18 n=1 Tax=Mycena indigotica TaxID=2126181 RepID=A0A8H6T7F9_9AGAR|nr:SFM domain-containing protein [Mycena indigotica]KAF7312184.1 SFM domain-containing protein [Mycena indigotica]